MFKREEVIERCEYRFNSIICFNGKTNHRIRAFKVDYEIKEALYATFLYEGEIANYLVLVGDDCIGFHHIHHEVFNVIKVPFRVSCLYFILFNGSFFTGSKSFCHWLWFVD